MTEEVAYLGPKGASELSSSNTGTSPQTTAVSFGLTNVDRIDVNNVKIEAIVWHNTEKDQRPEEKVATYPA